MDGRAQLRGADAAIGEVAGRQHGVVARAQLVALGLGRGSIDKRVALGRLLTLYPGVYAVGHRALTRHSRFMAAVLSCGPDAVLSHRSAAVLWRIRDDWGGAIEVTTRQKAHSRGPIRRHSSRLPADELTVEDGIPVTTVPRTVLDLAAVSPPEAVEAALRQAEYLRLSDPLSLPDLLARHPGRRGARAVRTALERRGETAGRTRSRFEERFVAFLDRQDLPRPQFNAPLAAAGRDYVVDCLWPGARLIAELDGWEAHGIRSAFREDRARDRRLAVAGYRTTRITWDQLDDEAAVLAADLRDLLNIQASVITYRP